MNTISQYLLWPQFQYSRQNKLNENLSKAWRRNTMLFLCLFTTVPHVHRAIPVQAISAKANIKGQEWFSRMCFRICTWQSTQKYFRQNFIFLKEIWSGKFVVICIRLFHGEKKVYINFRVYISHRMYKTFAGRNVSTKLLNLNIPVLELHRFIYCSCISRYIIQFYVSFMIKFRAVNFKNSLGMFQSHKMVCVYYEPSSVGCMHIRSIAYFNHIAPSHPAETDSITAVAELRLLKYGPSPLMVPHMYDVRKN
jgi:hypothetical protein